MKEIIVATCLFVHDDVDLNDEEQLETAVWKAFQDQIFDTNYRFSLGDYVIVPDDVGDDDRWSLTHHKI